MLKHPAECGLVVHTLTHSAGCHDTHAVSLSSVRALTNLVQTRPPQVGRELRPATPASVFRIRHARPLRRVNSLRDGYPLSRLHFERMPRVGPRNSADRVSSVASLCSLAPTSAQVSVQRRSRTRPGLRSVMTDPQYGQAQTRVFDLLTHPHRHALR